MTRRPRPRTGAGSAVAASEAQVHSPMSLAEETWRWSLVAVIGLTFVHLFAQRLSPLQLYPDEAQYWVWSRTLSFGYYSKPPMIAWIIAATTAALGDAEPFVRMGSALLQGAAALFVCLAARRLYDGRVGLIALLVYALCPAVQLGAFVISTDTPLCAFVAAALWLYAVIQTAEGRTRLLAAAGLGAALGLAFLSKYAALYALAGLALHLACSPPARRRWTWAGALLAVLAFALVAGPNVAWNAAHGFATVAETASDAGWARRSLFNPVAFAAFLASQLGVFGPAPFLILVVGGVLLAWRRRLAAADGLLLAWTAPPLVIVSVQALIAGANANWAAAAYAPASALVAAWLVRWRAWRWTAAILVSHALVAAVFFAGVTHPRLADAVGASRALKNLRGWRETVIELRERAQAESLTGPLTAVAVDSRFLYNEAAYYGRDYFGVGGPPLKVWLAGPRPRNEAESAAPLTAAFGGRVVGASFGGARTKAMMAAFASAGELEIDTIGLDRKESRRLDTFVAQGLKPRV